MYSGLLAIYLVLDSIYLVGLTLLLRRARVHDPSL